MEPITLPDLENEADVEIVRENLLATGAIYSAYLLEEARVFQVVDRIAELFVQGLLPLGRGRAADALRRYWLNGNRISERERRELYARVLGSPGGTAGVRPNREFPRCGCALSTVSWPTRAGTRHRSWCGRRRPTTPACAGRRAIWPPMLQRTAAGLPGRPRSAW